MTAYNDLMLAILSMDTYDRAMILVLVVLAHKSGARRSSKIRRTWEWLGTNEPINPAVSTGSRSILAVKPSSPIVAFRTLG